MAEALGFCVLQEVSTATALVATETGRSAPREASSLATVIVALRQPLVRKNGHKGQYFSAIQQAGVVRSEEMRRILARLANH